MVRQVLTIKSQLDFQLSILQTHQVLRPLTTTPPPQPLSPLPFERTPLICNYYFSIVVFVQNQIVAC